MRLTQFSDYSLRILMTLALDPGKRFTIGELSKRHRISRNHLTKVVHRLAKDGHIVTTRGQGGGVSIAKSTSSATLGDIVRSTEPDFAMAECFRRNGFCRFAPHCTLQTVLSDSLRAFFAVLDQHTLGDLVRDPLPLQRLLDSPAGPRKSASRSPARSKRTFQPVQ